jgi:hypothetical protein
LKEYVDNIKKEKIKELEEDLIPRPFFSKPLNTVQPTLTLEDILESNNKWKGSSSLLLAVRKYVGDGIQKRTYLIQEI